MRYSVWVFSLHDFGNYKHNHSAFLLAHDGDFMACLFNLRRAAHPYAWLRVCGLLFFFWGEQPPITSTCYHHVRKAENTISVQTDNTFCIAGHAVYHHKTGQQHCKTQVWKLREVKNGDTFWGMSLFRHTHGHKGEVWFSTDQFACCMLPLEKASHHLTLPVAGRFWNSLVLFRNLLLRNSKTVS